jgi:hypothetical protein
MSDGTVDRKTVLQVLRASGVDVSEDPDKRSNTVTLAKEDILECIALPQLVGRQMLHYLSRKFRVHIYHFYNPSI